MAPHVIWLWILLVSIETKPAIRKIHGHWGDSNPRPICNWSSIFPTELQWFAGEYWKVWWIDLEHQFVSIETNIKEYLNLKNVDGATCYFTLDFVGFNWNKASYHKNTWALGRFEPQTHLKLILRLANWATVVCWRILESSVNWFRTSVCFDWNKHRRVCED